VLRYLARYTHRVAISNNRLLALTPSPLGGADEGAMYTPSPLGGESRGEGTVTFRYKDYADGHKHKTLTLDALEFLRRFLQHVLPKGFMKIRHYGLLASRHRQQKLQRSRQLLMTVNLAAALACAELSLPPDATCDAARIEPAQLPHCPHCGGQRFLRLLLPIEETCPQPTCGDTS
jgi:hypothetical protein